MGKHVMLKSVSVLFSGQLMPMCTSAQRLPCTVQKIIDCLAFQAVRSMDLQFRQQSL